MPDSPTPGWIRRLVRASHAPPPRGDHRSRRLRARREPGRDRTAAHPVGRRRGGGGLHGHAAPDRRRDPGVGARAVRRRVPAPLPGRPAGARRPARPAPPGVRRGPAARRRAAGLAAHRAGGLARDHRPQPAAGAAVDRAARAGLPGARRRVPRRDAVALPAAHPRRGRDAAAGGVDHPAQPQGAVPGHLVGAAASGRHRPAGRGDGHRRPGGEGLRAGAARGRGARGRGQAAVRRAAARGQDDRAAQPRAAEPAHPRPGRGDRPRWLARALRVDQPGHVPRVHHLRGRARRARAAARRARRRGPAHAGGCRAGLRPGRLAARRRRSRGSGVAARGPAGCRARRRHLRLLPPRAGARWREPQREGGGDARAGRPAGVGQVDGRPAAAPLLRPAGG